MLSVTTAFTQEIKQNLTVEIPVRKVVSDKLQRVYIVSKDNSVNILDNQHQIAFRYSNRRMGKITHIDASNPIKVLLYSRDFGRVVLVDNTLAEVQEFVLSDFGFSDISVISQSNDNGFWLYDPLRFRLIKINQEGKTMITSSNLTDYGLQSPDILNIIESGNKVLLYEEGSGFILFDNFGQYIKKIPSKAIKSYRFDGKNIVAFDGKNIIGIDTDFGISHVLYTLENEDDKGITDLLYFGDYTIKVFENGLVISPRKE